MPESMRSSYWVALLAAALAACGGSGPKRPQPLSHHFDEYHIARVPIAERQEVFKAQNDYQIAKGEYMTAQTKLEDNATRAEVAKNELKQALLAEDSAKSKQKNAESTGDMNRVNTAKADLRAAEMARRAADQKVAAVKAEKKWLEKYILYTEEQMYAQEAKFELSKAQVAQQKNIRPKGFAMPPYKEQFDARSREAQRTKALADQEKAKYQVEKKKYDTMKVEAQRAGGGK